MKRDINPELLREQREARRSFRERLPAPLRALSRYIIPEKAHLDGLSELVQDHAAEVSIVPGRAYTIGVWNCARNSHSESLVYLQDLFESCDVVMLQEFRLTHEVRDLLARYPVSVVASRHFWLDDERTVSTGNCTVSKIQFAREPVVLEGPHEPWYRSPKTIIQCELPYIFGQTVKFDNVHGFNFGPAAVLQEQLDGFAVADTEHGGIAVLGGDFNTRNRKRMRVLEGISYSRDFSPVVFGSGVTSFGRWKLDGLYTRGVHSVVQAYTQSVPRRVSDHNKLKVEIIF